MIEDDAKILKVHYEWMLDILKRMKQATEYTHLTDTEKLAVLEYLIKQALKVEREE